MRVDVAHTCNLRGMRIERKTGGIEMVYDVYLLHEAKSSLKRLSLDVSRRIVAKIKRMRNDLAGDVKRLKAFVPSYRLRVGDWRVLFEIDAGLIIIHEIKHRSQAYDG
jgi:mRNA interferase RelE/StbE